MRLWHVLPGHLSGPLLNNQHRTCHLLLATVAGGTSYGGMSRYQNHAGFLVWMHWLCIQEMILRGGEHKSPVSALYYRTPPVRRLLYIYIPAGRMAQDYADLRTKEINATFASKLYDSRLPLKTCGHQLRDALDKVRVSGLSPSWLIA